MASISSSSDDKTSALLEIISARMAVDPHCIRRALVVGCGNGYEAGVIAEVFNCEVTAIDIDDTFVCPDPRVQFRRMDARAMQFEDRSFDLAFSFHAIEHIRGASSAAIEISRVLVNGGIFCIGTPNRSRLIGYIGSRDASLRQKLQWNINDYIARIQGRFKNDLGAHAGFTAKELLSLCSLIGTANDVSDLYFCRIYRRYKVILSAIRFLRLQAIAWPSVYCSGCKVGSSK